MWPRRRVLLQRCRSLLSQLKSQDASAFSGIVTRKQAVAEPPNTKGDPPALPGRQSKFDISGGRPRLSIGEIPKRKPPKHSHGRKMTAVPPEYAASRVVGLVHGKSAIDLRRAYRQAAAISVVGVAGHAGISYRRPGRMKRRYGTMCGTRSKRGNVSALEPPALSGRFSGRLNLGPVSDPTGRFERPMF